ncbi:MATE family efflux transporter [Jannaschia pagri]|uniref:Multidrug-efflux transporter n=2 Tax=Roseobacteraceae TaxID=2854170 RepID=A0ABQ4NGA3_9RHOB|nr:MATE family efflux transporter [Jannaschia sp. AI_61]GIT93454.1 MATE family efflux transporter [Jannaschia sp. AI_62]
MRQTLSLGLPLVGSQVAHILVGLTDTLMLGWYSVPALAAGTLGASFFFVVMVLGAGFAYAVLPMAAEAVGRDDETRARRVARMGLWWSTIYGIVTLPLFFFSGPILLAAGQEAQVAEDAQTYLRIAGLGLLPSLLAATLRSHLSALEHTQVVLVATLAAAGLNAVLNWLLIFGNLGAPELGIRGAAVASVAVHVLTAGILVLYATRWPGMERFELLKNIHRADWPVFGDIFRLGWPIGLTHLSESGLFVGSALMMGWLGTVPLAAHGIAIQIAALTFMVHMGLSQAATVRVGQGWGRSDKAGLLRAAIAATILSGIAVLGATILYLGAGAPIISLFLDPSDAEAPAILALGVHLLVLAALFQLVDAGQVMALGALRGVQDTRLPMVYAIVSYWALGIPASYVLGFPLGLGATGIWLGLCVGLAAAAVALAARFVGLVGRMPDGATSKS